MKKIMFYITGMKRGGAEKIISELCNEFIKKYNITLTTNYQIKCEYKLNNNIKHITIDEKNELNVNIIKKIITKLSNKRTIKLKKIIESEQPNYIVAFLPEPSIRLLKLKKYFPNIKFIVSVRNHPKYEFRHLSFIRNHFYKKADQIIIQSEHYKKYFSKELSNKMLVINNFIEKPLSKTNIKVEKKIVTVGRLVKQKNQLMLIKAFEKINKKIDDYKLEIYGFGKEKKKLEKYINNHNLKDKIKIYDKELDINNKISNATLFVLSSNYEGMPNSILEAMSLNLPIISTDSTEVIYELLENGKKGIIVPRKNTNILADKIYYLINNQKLLKKYKNHNMKPYEKDSILAKWEEVFK